MNPSIPTHSSPPKPSRFRWTRAMLLAVLLAGASALLFWPGRGAPVQIDVSEGTNAHAIARRLIDADLVQSRYPVLFWVKVRQASQKIHVGRYRIPKGRSAYWIVDDLMQGRTEKLRVVIPEGWASWQIAERLEASGICPAAPFLDLVKKKKLEGVLFPATYDFEAGLSPETVVSRLSGRFEQIWTSAMDARAKEIGMTRNEVVTMASIVEREVRVRDEGPMISAAYHNRLRRGMKLDADPTVQYALGHWKTRLTYADYRNTNSPYNTYLHPGLPPAPICSPGLESLNAALWPAKSDALFFVAQDDGRHSFSATYREHVNKVNRRNRVRRQAR